MDFIELTGYPERLFPKSRSLVTTPDACVGSRGDRGDLRDAEGESYGSNRFHGLHVPSQRGDPRRRARKVEGVKTPMVVKIMEALPRSAVRKTLRRLVPAQFWVGHETQI